MNFPLHLFIQPGYDPIELDQINIMNNLDKQYIDLLQDILANGVKKEDRTGTGTISVFGRTIRHKMSDGFPLLTTKKMAWKGIVSELIWILRGDTNVKWLVENKNYIWIGDAYKAFMDKNGFKKTELGYEGKTGGIKSDTSAWLTKEEFIERIKTDDEFAKKWGDLGPIYGKQWRNWFYGDWWWNGSRPMVEAKYFDQIQTLIHDLKNNPDSRRLMVSAWNPAELSAMTLPPCHYGFQCYTRELTWAEQVEWVFKNTDVEMENLYVVEEIAKPSTPKRAISLIWNQRSVDTPLGLPFNIASYGLLLTILGKICNMVPDELIGNLGDTHIYSNQIDGVKEQIGREYTVEERLKMMYDQGFDGDDSIFKTHEDIDQITAFAIPKRTRQGFRLPRVSIEKTQAFWEGFDVTQFGHLEPSDFVLHNYTSETKIEFPLSN